MSIAAAEAYSAVEMFEPATKPHELTVLRRADGRAPVAGKRVYRDADSEMQVQDNGGGAVFHVGKADCSTFESMRASIEALVADPLAFTISGAPRIGLLNADGAARTIVRRKSTFRDARRSVAVFDLDKVPISRDVTSDPQEACEMLVAALPKPLRGTKAVAVLSSTCGLDDRPHWRAQVYMLLDKALSPDRLKAAIKGLDAEVRRSHGKEYFPCDHWVDPKVAETVQPRFIGPPLFEGIANPHPQRVFVVGGTRERVRTGDLPKEPAAKRGRPKGSRKASKPKASTSGKTLKASAPEPAHAPHPAVPPYLPSEAELPDDADLFRPIEPTRSMTRQRFYDLALDLQRVALMRPWHGQAARGWRDDFVFRATDCACIAESLPSGDRAREIGEEIRRRIAPDMPASEMERYLTSLARRCDEDREIGAELGRDWLRPSESRKYHYRSSTLCRELDVSEAEQERMAALYTRRVADRRRYYDLRGPARVVASTREVITMHSESGTEKTDMTGFDDVTVKTAATAKPTPKMSPKAEPTPTGKTSGLASMKRAKRPIAPFPADPDAASGLSEAHTVAKRSSPDPQVKPDQKLNQPAVEERIQAQRQAAHDPVDLEWAAIGVHKYSAAAPENIAHCEVLNRERAESPIPTIRPGHPPMKGDSGAFMA